MISYPKESLWYISIYFAKVKVDIGKPPMTQALCYIVAAAISKGRKRHAGKLEEGLNIENP